MSANKWNNTSCLGWYETKPCLPCAECERIWREAQYTDVRPCSECDEQ